MRTSVNRILAWLMLVGVAATSFADDSVRPRVAEDPALRQELLRRMKSDQTARLALIDWNKAQGKRDGAGISDLDAAAKAEYDCLRADIQKADRDNTARLHAIVEQYGWPTRSLVGEDGSNAAWLLVQHADCDVKFQRKCLDLMAKLPDAEVAQRDVAYLTDRVLLAEGKPQRYGTQIESVNGKWMPRTLEDPTQVDERRAGVGLEPLAEYIRAIEAVYGSPAKE